MLLARLRPGSGGEHYIDLEQEFLFAATMLVHIERLPGVRVLAKRSWFLSDDFHATFVFGAHTFTMELAYGRFQICASESATPIEALNRLIAHINAYRTVWPHEFVWAEMRYFTLPSRVGK